MLGSGVLELFLFQICLPTGRVHSGLLSIMREAYGVGIAPEIAELTVQFNLRRMYWKVCWPLDLRPRSSTVSPVTMLIISMSVCWTLEYIFQLVLNLGGRRVAIY